MDTGFILGISSFGFTILTSIILWARKDGGSSETIKFQDLKIETINDMLMKTREEMNMKHELIFKMEGQINTLISTNSEINVGFRRDINNLQTSIEKLTDVILDRRKSI